MLLSRNLNEKVIFVTGASSGIGKSLLVEMAKRHPRALFFCITRKLENILPTMADISLNTEVRQWECDLVNRVSVAKSVEECIRYFGKIDEVWHFAGTSCWASYESSEEILFQKMMELNFYATNNLLKETLSHLKNSGGRFYTATSVQGEIGVPYHAAYAASKHAVEGLIRCVSLETPEVFFSVIRPSWVSDTGVKHNALDSFGKKVQNSSHRTEKSGSAVSLKHAIKKIGEHIETSRSPCLYIPSKYSILPLLQSMFPYYLQKLIRGKFKR